MPPAKRKPPTRAAKKRLSSRFVWKPGDVKKVAPRAGGR